MKLLVAIMTCHKLDYFVNDNTVDYNTAKGRRCTSQTARVEAIRATYLKELQKLGIDYKFFYGTQPRIPRQTTRNKYIKPEPVILREALPDEVFLECGDNYTQNPQKMKAIIRYALDNEYDMLLRIDDDTFLWPERLLTLDADYVGAGMPTEKNPNPEFHPGGCLFLSSHAMRVIHGSNISNCADDVWIGKVMKQNHVRMDYITTSDGRSAIHNEWGEGYAVSPMLDTTELISAHSCMPDIMRQFYTGE